jgi:hypothetical protein
VDCGGAGAGAPAAAARSSVDDDGNERAGIRLPDVAVPLATYTGGTSEIVDGGRPAISLRCSARQFHFQSPPARAAPRSRRSIDERYPTRDDYIDKVRAAADALVRKGYLLVDDIERIVQRSTDNWDNIVGSRP